MQEHQATTEQPKKRTYRRTLAADRSRVAVYVNINKDVLEKKTVAEAQALVESALSLSIPTTVLTGIASAIGVNFHTKRKNYDRDVPKTTIGSHTKIRLLAGFVSNLYEQLGIAVPPALKVIHRGNKIADDDSTDKPNA